MNKISRKLFRYSLLLLPVLGVTMVSLFFLAAAPVPSDKQNGLTENPEELIQRADSQQTDLFEDPLLNLPGSRSEMVLPGWWDETGSEKPETNGLDIMILTLVTDGLRTGNGSNRTTAEPTVPPVSADQQIQTPITNPSTVPTILQVPPATPPSSASISSEAPPMDDNNGDNRGGGKDDKNNSGSGSNGNSGSGGGNNGNSGGGNSGSGGE